MRIVTIGMFVGALALGHGFAEAAPPALAAPLTLEEVLRLVEERSPALRAAAARAEEAEGLREQAGAFPNPELALEAENFGGAGEAREFDAAETTLRLTQEVEIGKRGPRMREARAASSIAALGEGAVRLDLRREAAVRFAELLAAEERALLAREGAETAANVERAVAGRVAAGRDSPVEEKRAGAERALASLAAEKARIEVEAKRRALAALWGGWDPAAPEIEGSLSEAGVEPPALDALLASLEASPAARLAEAEARLAEASLGSARRERIPDLFVEGGVRETRADDERAYVGAVGFEIPLFDRGGGAVRAAEAAARGAEAEQEGALAALRADLAAAHAALVQARAALLAIAGEVIPAARAAFEAAEEGYAAGKFGYLDVQDARRSFVAAREELVAAGVDYRTAAADVERLIGRPIDNRSDIK